MPYKRVPSVCPICTRDFMAKPKQPTCSWACGYKLIRQRTDADVATRVDRTGPLIERFPEYGPCWTYTGDKTPSGYGFLHRRDEECLMHRRAWIEATGDILTRADVIGHICDNPPCIRNDGVGYYEVRGILLPRRGHLFRGTDADNVADMVSKGRQNRGEQHHFARPERIRRGEAVHNARLTYELVLYLRRRYAEGNVTFRALATETGFGEMTICRAVRGRSWQHVS